MPRSLSGVRKEKQTKAQVAPAAVSPADLFDFENLPDDTRQRIAAMLFDQFTQALASARAASVVEVTDAQALLAGGGAVSTEDMADMRLVLGRCATVSRAGRDIFRPYYITASHTAPRCPPQSPLPLPVTAALTRTGAQALFRSVVHEAEISVSDGDGILQGVTFAGRALSVDQCASEIGHLLRLVNHTAKVRFTGGTRELLAIPRYHEHYIGAAGKTSGLISKQQAKEIFTLTDKEYAPLPACGQRKYLLDSLSRSSSAPFPPYLLRIQFTRRRFRCRVLSHWVPQ